MTKVRGDVIYLLGAGASKGAGLKTSNELLAGAKRLFENAPDPLVVSAFGEIAHALERHDPQCNFEDLLDAVQSLLQRDESLLFRFTPGLTEPLQSLTAKRADLFHVMYAELLKFLNVELLPADAGTHDTLYLRKLAALASESTRPSIFTLNYDLLLEHALEDEAISYSTGFREATPIEQALYTP